MLSSWSSTMRMRPRPSGPGVSRGTSGTAAGDGTTRSGAAGRAPAVAVAAPATAAPCPAGASPGILRGVLAKEALDLGNDHAWLARVRELARAAPLHLPR